MRNEFRIKEIKIIIRVRKEARNISDRTIKINIKFRRDKRG